MKKNILTIIIMAITLINTILLAVLIFAIVPTSNKTNKLVRKVAAIVDLELESPEAQEEIAVSDIEGYDLPEQMTINLKSDDDKSHFALVNVSLSINTKHKDYSDLQPKIAENVNGIKEIVSDEFGKYSMDEVKENKEVIKEQVLKRIQELFKSDFIISVSFGNIITQ
jgi:flagellar FliL protein